MKEVKGTSGYFEQTYIEVDLVLAFLVHLNLEYLLLQMLEQELKSTFCYHFYLVRKRRERSCLSYAGLTFLANLGCLGHK